MPGPGVLLAAILDVLSLKKLSDALYRAHVTESDSDYAVHRAFWLLLEEGRHEDALRLARSRWERVKSPRIGRDLAHALLKRKDFQHAFQVAKEMSETNPANPWLRLFAADVAWFFLEDEDRALSMYLDAVPSCEAAMPDIYPQAVLYKRLTKIYRRRGDEERLLPALSKFYSLAPTNFHDEEFILLAELLHKRGDSGAAREVLDTGCKVMPRCVPLREAYEKMGLGKAPEVLPRRTPPIGAVGTGAMAGVSRHPVKTRLLTEVDDPVEVVKSHVRGRVRAGDVVTLSSCVAAIMEGRMVMEGVVPASSLSKFLSRLIAGAHRFGPFGASAPMANPLSVQVALEEVGTLRLAAAALAGAVGKLLGIKGWFYVICGPQVAQIDDILGSIPPYDYYVIMGPKDPFALSERIAASLGEGVESAIIDANDLGIAWAVGHSRGVDRKVLESRMSDNPAGNQDQMTPIVIVRIEDEAREEGEAER